MGVSDGKRKKFLVGMVMDCNNRPVIKTTSVKQDIIFQVFIGFFWFSGFWKPKT